MNPFNDLGTSAESSFYVDVEGDEVPISRAFIDQSEDCLDLAKLRWSNDRWYYGDRQIALEDGVFIFDYSENDYRTQDAYSSGSSPTTSTGFKGKPPSSEGNLSTSQDSGQKKSDDANRDHIDDMKGLGMHRIQRSKSLKVLSTPGSSRMVDDENSENFYMGVTSYAKVMQSLSGPARESRIGFNPEQLVLNGALFCHPCRPSDLVYAPTLTVFSEERFSDTPQDVMNAIKPALVLAENMILKGNPLFWVTLACANRVMDTDLSKDANFCVEKLETIDHITPEAMHYTISKLQLLGRRLLFHWRSLSNAHRVYGNATAQYLRPSWHPISGPLAPGEFWPADEPLMLPGWKPSNPWEQMSNISLDKDWYIMAKKVAATKHPDVAWVLRFYFFFAVNICHELAHAFENKCGNGAYWESLQSEPSILSTGASSAPFRPPRVKEAYFKSYPFNEMGAVFEWETFGGRVHPINGDITMKYGMCVYDGGGAGAPLTKFGELRGRPYAKAIPMGYIEELQQQSFWARPMSPNRLLVPECGPSSLWSILTSTIGLRTHMISRRSSDDSKKRLSAAFEEFIELPPSTDKGQDIVESGQKGKSTTPIKQKRRYFQTKIDQSPFSSGADSAKIMAELRSEAPDEDCEMSDIQTSGTEYELPPPDQPAIDDKFHYARSLDSSMSSNSNDSRHSPFSDSYDPLTIPPHRMKIYDKWVLFEEYCHLAHGWDAPTFFAKRDTGNYFPIHSRFIPRNSTANWGEAEVAELRELRLTAPELSFPIRRAKKIQNRKANRKKWIVLSEMEELCTYKGYSRIYFQRSLANAMPLPEGMTGQNFDQQFRHELEAYRITWKATQKAEHQQAILDGQIIPITSGPQPAQPGLTTSAETQREPSPVQINKITRYFKNIKSSLKSRSETKSPTATRKSVTIALSDDEEEEGEIIERRGRQGRLDSSQLRFGRPRYRSRDPVPERSRSASPQRD